MHTHTEREKKEQTGMANQMQALSQIVKSFPSILVLNDLIHEINSFVHGMTDLYGSTNC